MELEKVGVVGLGLIGSVWARHWAADGMLGAAWSRTPQPDFPHWVADPAQVAARASTIVICVADPAAVMHVVDLLIPHLTTSHLVIQSSTIDPQTATNCAVRVAAAGAAYLEAPFTGSKPAAEQRKTVFYLGGDQATILRAEPTLSRVSQLRLTIGTPAMAATLKLAMNIQIACQAQALCEALAFARRAGIGDDTFFAALRPNAAWSGVTALKEPKLRAADFSPQFAVKHMLKDMRLAAAALTPHQAPLATAVAQCLASVAAAGGEDDDFIALIRNVSAG
jgi:3-hydroxyisobutyrate dehydrogenase-like beta-hydroxyacid dehydrogenase